MSAIVNGAVPCVTMLIGGFALSGLRSSPIVEATTQFFCAGILIAAVSIELFPMIMDPTLNFSVIGLAVSVFCGFAFAILIIHGTNFFVDSLENESEYAGPKRVHDHRTSPPSALNLYQATGYSFVEQKEPTSDDLDVELSHSITTPTMDTASWEEEPIKKSVEAIALPSHKSDIRSHIVDINRSIEFIQGKVCEINHSELSSRLDREQLSEIIDDQVHRLQYKVDRSRRLLQGPSQEIEEQETAKQMKRKAQITRTLAHLKALSNHILEHIDEPSISAPKLREIHGHIDDMDKIISRLHERVEKSTWRWRKCKHHPSEIPMPSSGSKIPMSLIVPVVVDCAVDGFLIGLSSALNSRVGLTLGVANGIEMGFLGMAVALRINKCTGSTATERFISILLPPLLLLLTSYIGSIAGEEARSHPMLYQCFIAFGVVALLFLACNELLWEARKNSPFGEDGWQGTAILFLGVFMMILLDKTLN